MATPRTPPPVEQDARGIVDPARLQRMARLTRYPVGELLAGLVDRFWAVDWALPAGVEHVQRILTHPGANLYVGVPEAGDAGGRGRWRARSKVSSAGSPRAGSAARAGRSPP